MDGVAAGGSSGVGGTGRLAAFSRIAAAAAAVATSSSGGGPGGGTITTHPVTNSKHKIVSNGGGALSWVLNRSMDPRTYEQQQPLIAQLPQVPLLPQQIITSGTRKDCIRLRGLPFEAQVEHILEFLGEHAKNIVFQGVHMVYNAAGQPSGEAFIQMDSEHSSFMAAQQRHHRYMPFGKKQRYIEVFQCSGEDMHMVLTGGLPTQRPPVVSPGGTMVPPFGAFPLGPAPPVISAVGTVTPRIPTYPMAYPTMFYWPYPYPSPPVSPSSPYYSSTPHLATPATSPHQTIIPPECIPIHANGDVLRHNGEPVATM